MNLPIRREPSFFPSTFFDVIDELFHTPTFLNKKKDFPKVAFGRDKDNLYVKIAVAGYNKDLLNIFIENGILNISYNKKDSWEEPQPEEGDIKILYSEIKESSFERRISLPIEILKVDDVKSDCKDGIVTLTIPFKEENKPKKIEIKI